MEGSPQTPFLSDVAPGEALSIKRFFTSPGQHAFDTVEWELRDARIGHGGRVAFEQAGVEFPKTWSQNATNIVAQKYFRGQLGSVTREHSVKQMIGRVAGTIADWGRSRGYFASVQDGDAFESELAYVLVHQMAAFNSPVWFNVGFEESPQCSACLPYRALISTPDGMVQIGELVDGDQVGREVYDAHGVTRIVATKANGIKPVYRVRLRNGSYVEATADHVVKAVRERRTQPQWLRVDELEVGMRMHLYPHRAKVSSGSLVGVGGGSPFADDAAAEAVKVSEAALAGWLQADGFVGQYDHGTNRSLTIEFQVADDEERAWVEGHLDIALPDVHRKVRDAGTLDVPVQRIRLYGEVLGDFVERWNLLARGTEMTVPYQLWTASHEEIAAYLRSVFQADGYVSVRRENGCEQGRIGFAVIGEQWTEDIQILLGTLGIFSRRTRKRSDRHDLHEVCIAIASERALFAELVGFVDPRKQGKLLESLELRDPKRCPDLREEEIVAIEPVGTRDVYDIQTESGEYLCHNIAVHNCFILSVQDTMESILDWNTKEGKIFLGGSGSGINLSNIRGSMEPLSKGGTASGPVSFMRGADSWAGTIKSGGKTRRAAKMVVLDVDHPDIREFIWCKAKEEKKANALRDAGFDMSIDGEGFTSIQYQNANNSVRLSDDFMRAVEKGGDWHLIARATGQPVGDPIPARELMREIAEAAWQCADPGVQYDTTINQWHTCPVSGRINASNPCCFVGETPVHTSSGPVAIAELVRRASAGEPLPHVASVSASGDPLHVPIKRAFSSGLTTELCDVETEHGERFSCTPEHRFLTVEDEWVQARDLAGRSVRSLADHVIETGGGDSPELVLRIAQTRILNAEVTQVAPTEVYDLEIENLHNFSVGAIVDRPALVVHNSEYMHVDDSACNLSSLNLMKFRRPDGTFDVASFEHAVDIMLLAQEIIVGPSSYPTEQIAVNARAFRQLGLGYANLGAFLMSNGMAYDSDAGRGTAAAITSLMTGRAYLQSARVAAAIGPYERYAENRDAHNAVMRLHRDASGAIPDAACSDTALLSAARKAWDEAVAAGELYGYRNAQASVLAPTGTISFLMDCDTTGVEPDFSLVKFKELVGGGQMTIVNQTIPMALRTLGYSEEQIEQIEAYIDEHATIVGAPGLAGEHLSIFDVAVGERAISHMGHIKMMGAVQPFISGAISKTVNLPYEATVEDIADAYLQAWHCGVKALAIYRDGSKTAQALRTDAHQGKDTDATAEGGGYTQEQVDALIAEAVAAARSTAIAEVGPKRNRMPRERQSITHKFSIAGHEGYITAGMYEDGTLGEIFLTDIGKEGSTLRGLLNSFATSISIALQYGVPLEKLVEKFSYMRFEPEGITQNPEIPFAKSMPDYIMRWLASRFLDTDIQEELGIMTPEVRARKMAEDAGTSFSASDTSGPTNGGAGNRGGGASAQRNPARRPTGVAGSQPATTRAAAEALTDSPPVVPARMRGLDLGPACSQCGGMMQRTGSCYTCSSCGNNTGCG
ncbi:MAG: ribonucleoside-diphosphate reductase alpha chain [Solirubrobacteraceae bacterium]|nr:ribonucleoside-diphosphate reductase alpha chain [Solirubrobacteraceae bacterium]